MATNDSAQMGQDVPYHKRIAMGAKLDGSSLGAKESTKTPSAPKRGGGALAQAKKKYCGTSATSLVLLRLANRRSRSHWCTAMPSLLRPTNA